VLHARKHRTIAVAKASEQKPTLAGRATGRASSQLLSASSIGAKSALRKASQVFCEPKTSLPKQTWKPKKKALCEASGEVPPGDAPPQLPLSREDKGKLLIQFGSFAEAIRHEARLLTLPSPNLGAVTPCANLVLTSEVTDGLVYTAPVPQGTSDVLNRKTKTEGTQQC